jgi:HSP20 family protein
MFDLMPWRKREGKDLMGFRSELDNLFNRFFDLDFPISREFFKEEKWMPGGCKSASARHLGSKADTCVTDVLDYPLRMARTVTSQ